MSRSVSVAMKNSEPHIRLAVLNKKRSRKSLVPEKRLANSKKTKKKQQFKLLSPMNEMKESKKSLAEQDKLPQHDLL